MLWLVSVTHTLNAQTVSRKRNSATMDYCSTIKLVSSHSRADIQSMWTAPPELSCNRLRYEMDISRLYPLPPKSFLNGENGFFSRPPTNVHISSVTIASVIQPIAVNSRTAPTAVPTYSNARWVLHSTKTHINAIGPIRCPTVTLKLTCASVVRQKLNTKVWAPLRRNSIDPTTASGISYAWTVCHVCTCAASVMRSVKIWILAPPPKMWPDVSISLSQRNPNVHRSTWRHWNSTKRIEQFFLWTGRLHLVSN